MIWCYHHNDLDGRCAAAVAYRHFVLKDQEWLMQESDYHQAGNPHLVMSPGDVVLILDFSFPKEVMERFVAQGIRWSDIIWIDHHKTSFDLELEYREINDEPLPGVRSQHFSGCELTWGWMVSVQTNTGSWIPKNIPWAVRYIGDRDTWKWAYGEGTARFCEGMRCHNTNPLSNEWDALVQKPSAPKRIPDVVKKIQEEGETCIKYRNIVCDDYATSYGFETVFEGHECFAMGLYMWGSEAFGQDRMEWHDICISFVYVGDKWQVGLYSDTIDVSGIAKKYGGGGHTGAAGFVCDELPFHSCCNDPAR